MKIRPDDVSFWRQTSLSYTFQYIWRHSIKALTSAHIWCQLEQLHRSVLYYSYSLVTQCTVGIWIPGTPVVARPLIPGSLLVPVGVHLGVGFVVRYDGSSEQPSSRPTLENHCRLRTSWCWRVNASVCLGDIISSLGSPRISSKWYCDPTWKS